MATIIKLNETEVLQNLRELRSFLKGLEAGSQSGGMFARSISIPGIQEMALNSVINEYENKLNNKTVGDTSGKENSEKINQESINREIN